MKKLKALLLLLLIVSQSVFACSDRYDGRNALGDVVNGMGNPPKNRLCQAR